MPSFDTTTVWQQSLALQNDDAHQASRDKLRQAYKALRVGARQTSGRLSALLPDLSFNQAELDSLWASADLLVGRQTFLTPAEAFVLGSTFVLHNLGIGLAAFPNGFDQLVSLPLWKDTVTGLYRREGISSISEELLQNPSLEIKKQALAVVLRHLYAHRASELALVRWADSNQPEQFLFPDDELRRSFGPLIGQLADSIRWSLSKVAEQFGEEILTANGLPPDWSVDPLKLACLLRGTVVCCLTEPDLGVSLPHLLRNSVQIRSEGDRLAYFAEKTFGQEDAEAWWQIHDALRSVDTELRQIDSLFIKHGRGRLSIIGVAHIEDPSRLMKFVRVDGWQPVDAQIRVSAVADLVTKLGGRELYGESVIPPLRELIQNAADAVRARRALESREATWGEISIRLGEDAAGKWIQVQDTGIGMSKTVLTGPFLDFGTSFWGTSLMHQELPGLETTGFQSVGRYGIGFFSVFMWGDHVQVITRRYNQPKSETLVLEFVHGIGARPILRKALEAEELENGGTQVRVWWKDESALPKLVKSGASDDSEEGSLSATTARIAPCLDVSVIVDDTEGQMQTVVEANDWLTLDETVLRKRLNRGLPARILKMQNLRSGINLQEIPDPAWSLIPNDSGAIVGRGAIWSKGLFGGVRGVITVGGLGACGLQGISGFLMGSPVRASRDSAVPVISIQALRRWAEKERDKRLEEGHPEVVLERIASVLRSLGVDVSSLPVARSKHGWLTSEKIRDLATDLTEAWLVSSLFLESYEKQSGKIELKPEVIVVESGGHTLIASQSLGIHDRWPKAENHEDWGDQKFYAKILSGVAIEALASGWGCPLSDVIKSSSLRNDDEIIQREVGTFRGEPVVQSVAIIRKPGAAGSSPVEP